MGKKKILVVSDWLGWGGGEKSMIAFLNVLAQCNVEVTVMLMTRGGVYENLVPKGMMIIDIPRLKGIKGTLTRFSYSLALRKKKNANRHGAELHWQSVGRYLPTLSENYDIAVAYHQGFPTYFVADKVNADKKIAWVNTDPISAKYSVSFNRPFYNKLDQVVAVSKSISSKLVADGFVGKQPKVIYDIIDPKLIQCLADEFTTKMQKNDNIYLCTVGRLSKAKNYFLAVETAKILQNTGIHFQWYFVGDGEDRLSIEEKIKEYGLEGNIILTGAQVNPYPWMKVCDIYVQTSSFEGFGLTIAEAKILHKPIVSTNFTVVTNQITNGVNGIITEKNPKALAEGILSVINNPNLKNSLIEATNKETNETMITESKKIKELLELD